MNELQQLRDEITQLNTALTIKNGTIEQLKARVAELEAQQPQEPVAWAVSHVAGKVDSLCATYTLKSSAITHVESFASELGSPLALTPLYTKPSVLKDRNVTYSTSTQTPARQVPEGWQLVPVEPTEGMRTRAKDHLAEEGMVVTDWLIDTIYTVTLAAAPQAEQPGGDS